MRLSRVLSVPIGGFYAPHTIGDEWVRRLERGRDRCPLQPAVGRRGTRQLQTAAFYRSLGENDDDVVFARPQTVRARVSQLSRATLAQASDPEELMNCLERCRGPECQLRSFVGATASMPIHRFPKPLSRTPTSRFPDGLFSTATSARISRRSGVPIGMRVSRAERSRGRNRPPSARLATV